MTQAMLTTHSFSQNIDPKEGFNWENDAMSLSTDERRAMKAMADRITALEEKTGIDDAGPRLPAVVAYDWSNSTNLSLGERRIMTALEKRFAELESFVRGPKPWPDPAPNAAVEGAESGDML